MITISNRKTLKTLSFQIPLLVYQAQVNANSAACILNANKTFPILKSNDMFYLNKHVSDIFTFCFSFHVRRFTPHLTLLDEPLAKSIVCRNNMLHIRVVFYCELDGIVNYLRQIWCDVPVQFGWPWKIVTLHAGTLVCSTNRKTLSLLVI